MPRVTKVKLEDGTYVPIAGGADGPPGPPGPPGLEGSGKALLGRIHYNPGTQVVINSPQNPTTTWEAISPTNLSVTFTSPPEGEVFIHYYTFSLACDRVGFMQGSTMIPGSIVWCRESAATLVLGLTPDTEYTWKLAWWAEDYQAQAYIGGSSTLIEASPAPVTVGIYTTGVVAGVPGGPMVIPVQPSAPSSPVIGQLWFDSDEVV